VPALIASGRRVVKPWGHEIVWAETDRYAGKLLVIDARARLSLHVHVRKDESILVLSGRIGLLLEDDNDELLAHELGPGDAARIPAGRQHRIAARSRAEVIEVSSPELDDVVRLADDYGRVNPAVSVADGRHKVPLGHPVRPR
jgi:mannose-6-phosphate isomerase-like protein (cupin superfamily)